MRISACRHTMERARVTTPAARRVALKNHQLSINFLEGILLRTGWVVRVGDCVPSERRRVRVGDWEIVQLERLMRNG